jgi:hypothetical protein
MSHSSLSPACSVLLVTSLLSFGCGGGRQLESVTLSPVIADAQSFANGQVPFSATGNFSKPPSPQPLTSKDVTWCVGSSTGVCAGNINSGATVDQSGLAQCVPGFSGTATILAGKATPAMNPDGGAQMSIFGAAQLICP